MKGRPGIRKVRIRPVQASFPCTPLIAARLERELQPTFMDRFSAAVRTLGSRLIRFRAPRKARA